MKAPRWIVWSSCGLLFWVSASGPCLAGGAITGGVEPAYTVCLSSKSTCNDLWRTQLRLQYKPYARRGFSVRIRLLRAYQMTLANDNDDGASEEERTSKFDPPFDLIDVKLRFSAPDGRDHYEVRTGYAYQSSNPNMSNGYHAVYASGDYYFGPPMPSGWGGLSRRWDVLLRVTQNLFATASRPTERLVQLVPTYTVPLNSDGSTRVYASYAREVRSSGVNTVRTPSNRFELGAYRDPTRWLELYARMALWGTRGIPGTAKFVVGADITI
jgi:hypothetical protein